MQPCVCNHPRQRAVFVQQQDDHIQQEPQQACSGSWGKLCPKGQLRHAVATLLAAGPKTAHPLMKQSLCSSMMLMQHGKPQLTIYIQSFTAQGT
jgi:hypothetical protein